MSNGWRVVGADASVRPVQRVYVAVNTNTSRFVYALLSRSVGSPSRALLLVGWRDIAVDVHKGEGAAHDEGETIMDLVTAWRATDDPLIVGESDLMKIGAESVRPSRKIQGDDGAGWVAAIKAAPMRTLPPGAASLVVEYFESLLVVR